MPAPKLTQASVKNAIAAATAAGLAPTAMVVQADGSLRLEFLKKQFDNATNSEPPAVVSDVDHDDEALDWRDAK